MKTELKEKMQKAAEKYQNSEEFSAAMNCGNCFEDGAEYGFEKGAEAMYAELAPLVEWVSVEDRLPEPSFEQVFLVKGLVRHKKYGWIPYYPATRLRSICNGVPIWKGFENDENHKITHWRKIEL